MTRILYQFIIGSFIPLPQNWLLGLYNVVEHPMFAYLSLRPFQRPTRSKLKSKQTCFYRVIFG